MSAQWITFISSHLLQSLYDTFSDPLVWLHQSAAWQGALNASCHIFHTGRCTHFCAGWSADLLAFRVCSPSSPLIHGWTGASTRGAGGANDTV